MHFGGLSGNNKITSLQYNISAQIPTVLCMTKSCSPYTTNSFQISLGLLLELNMPAKTCYKDERMNELA